MVTKGSVPLKKMQALVQVFKKMEKGSNTFDVTSHFYFRIHKIWIIIKNECDLGVL